ncbi:hypothetical protein N6H18_17430 [Reichenbachiella agarivorans]|uniref:Lipoprotein n=1 Tax=Reichenbachiella agarivorans TaxID=2979464 RepID=A0ABY6CNR1_9BACT|nr:hypothetical protein [Reichenbachiella agarivorans]UXP32127.1 hypothetical protein N6H18_17430 [Reichenbachiella agarivorans]
MNLFQKLLRLLAILSTGLSLVSCVSSKGLELNAVWESDLYESKKYRKIVVFGLTKSMHNNHSFEIDAVKYLKSKGINSVAGHEVYDIKTDGNINPTHMKRYLFSLGFDGILTASLIDPIDSQDEHVSQEALGHHGEGMYRFGQYFQNRYETLESSEKTDFAILETNFYMMMDYNEFDGSGLVWISHYNIDQELRNDFPIDEYARTITKSLLHDGVVMTK